ncbi:mechanosensitive ion channel family protein [bacterium]|nr:mechanosensitive ion channel family protein [bacterium]
MIYKFLFILLFSFNLSASPLEPVKLDSPRDTMRTFITSMISYKKGLKNNDEQLISKMDDAIRCLNLNEVPKVVARSTGEQAAIFLKETIDRVIKIDFNLIPDSSTNPYWRLKGTEIAITQVDSGPRKGQFLISAETVERSKEFYKKVKHLPYIEGTGKGALYREPFSERALPSWSKQTLLGAKYWQWIGILISILIGFILKFITERILRLFRKTLLTREESLRRQTILSIESPSGFLVATLFWYISINALQLEGTLLSVTLTLVKICISICLIWATFNFSSVLSESLMRFTSKTKSTLDDQLAPLVSKALRLFIVVFGVLMAIQNLGFNVMSLMAGLGIGGLAFALAAKDTVSNLFGSVMIIVDNPFKVGDWIKADSYEGTVQDVGFRSTRLRTFYNSLISVPNAILANAVVDNMGERSYRRSRFVLGLTYDTPKAKIEEFVDGVKEIIHNNDFSVKDKYYVAFYNYGSHSLDVLVNFFLETPDYVAELKEKQDINLKILQLAERINVEFAFPTQTILLENQDATQEISQ